LRPPIAGRDSWREDRNREMIDVRYMQHGSGVRVDYAITILGGVMERPTPRDTHEEYVTNNHRKVREEAAAVIIHIVESDGRQLRRRP